MANLTPTFRAAQYEPSGVIYNYIYSIQTQIPEYDGFELAALESNGYTKLYPSQYCNSLVFGAGDAYIDQRVDYNGAGNYHQPLMNDPKVYADSNVNLAYPIKTMFFGGATRFTSEMEFATPQGDTYPSMLVITRGRPTIVDWYKNGEKVATDTIANPTSDFAIAVVASGNTITGYSYVYHVSGGMFTSGLKTNADVINILNNGGYAGSNDDTYGWQSEEQGDFILSRIFDADGYDATSGRVAGGSIGDTVNTTNIDLDNRNARYGGYRGTDIVQYITGTSSNAEGWSKLNNDPATDGLEMPLPSTEGNEFVIKWNYSGHKFEVYNNETYITDFTPQWRTSGGSYVYLTWYKQSLEGTSATQYPIVYITNAGGYPQYTMEVLNIGDNLEIEQFDNMALLEDLIEGYDPNSGQEDEKQEDPDDVEDPANDPLATGFLYAFMVDSTDMLNLADALVPDTLAQKLKADFGNNLFEFIVSYHMMPCLTNATSLNKTAIAYRGTPFLYGDNNTQLMLSPITKSWYKVDCGAKVCMPKGCRQDGFENWAHANVQLYLPFIGFVHLNTADVWNKTISIVYTFDILQGTCVANVGVGNNGTIYSYEGICKYAIPFTTAVDKSNQELLSGIFSSAGAAVSIGGVVAGAASPTALMGAAGGIANAAGSFISAAEHKSVINRGGCLSGAPGWNMPRKPALIITVPDAIRPGMIYNDTTGYPCFETGQLSSWQNNYVEVASIDLKANINSDGSVPNDNELDMINSTLKGGVYV